MSKSLYIVDGHAQIYAAFYAPLRGNLMSPSGEPTRATYIFTTMLLKLLDEHKPDYLVVAMDAPGKTFRHELFDQYKANRPPMPEELSVQIARIDEILTAMNIPVLRKGPYEADDIIGTLCRREAGQGLEIYICSKDKDLQQLISDGVSMIDLKDFTVTDAAALKEKKGITPRQVIDVLALTGDTSDNIPGVPDVGPKTAVGWIQTYGSIENLLAHQHEITGKRGESLRASVDQLALSRQLVTLDCSVPLDDVSLADLERRQMDRHAVAKLFGELGFSRLIDRLDLTRESPGTNTAAPTAAPKETSYHLIDTEPAFLDFVKKLKAQKIFAVDTETTSLRVMQADLVGMSFSWSAGTGYYLPLRAPMGLGCLDLALVKQHIGPILADASIKKVGQNLKYDINVLRRAGMPLAGAAFDTMIASWLLDSTRGRHNMDDMAADYLHHETIKIHTLIGKGKKQTTFDTVDTHLACDYAAEDADVTWRLYEYLDARLTDATLRKVLDTVEMPFIDVLAAMEHAGIAVDVAFLKKLDNQFADHMELLLGDIYAMAGQEFNVDSPKQLGNILFDKLGLKSVKNTSGGASGKSSRSTDAGVLEVLAEEAPIAAAVLEYRTYSKLKNTYVTPLPGMICPSTGRLHGSFHQTGTATGRLSSSDPNLQNIPVRTVAGREIRRAFVAARGHVLLAADYSQIELRMLGHLSGDPALIEAFVSGQDIHRFVASQVYDVPLDDVTDAQRSFAKAVNFGIIYGQSAFGLAKSPACPPGRPEFHRRLLCRYDRIGPFMDACIDQAKTRGYVETILGHRRALPEINDSNANRRNLAARMAVNNRRSGLGRGSDETGHAGGPPADS